MQDITIDNENKVRTLKETDQNHTPFIKSKQHEQSSCPHTA